MLPGDEVGNIPILTTIAPSNPGAGVINPGYETPVGSSGNYPYLNQPQFGNDEKQISKYLVK